MLILNNKIRKLLKINILKTMLGGTSGRVVARSASFPPRLKEEFNLELGPSSSCLCIYDVLEVLRLEHGPLISSSVILAFLDRV